ncbi:CASP-like protein 2C1 [Hevea brasiliensis]|uniref:CASP-like protein 2C1 n=1 Tax=Hevea brasiliensis TaxID=3981 RepID=UPI0025EF8529|nr:CASP-like protein 2C1 [Hevea brasiliensis]
MVERHNCKDNRISLCRSCVDRRYSVYPLPKNNASQSSKIEAFPRLCAILFLVLAACLVGLDSQTKSIAYLGKKFTSKDLALLALVYVDSVAAAYNLIQLISRSSFLARYKGSFKSSYRYMDWCCYLLDQIAVYITFAATSTVQEHSVLAATGAEAMQWMKWCNKFTRYCHQIGGALICSYIAYAFMGFISSIAALNLCRLCSPKQFLLLKTN